MSNIMQIVQTKEKRKFAPKVIFFLFLWILFLVSLQPASAIEVPKLDVENLLRTEGNGFYMCKADEVDIGNCDRFSSIYENSGGQGYTLIVFNVPARAQFFEHPDLPQSSRKITIDYDGVGDVLCSYEFDDNGTMKELPCTQAIGGDSAIHPYFINNTQQPDAFILDLGELCSTDDGGTGNDCSRQWNDQIKSYLINLNVVRPSNIFACKMEGEQCVVDESRTDCANGRVSVSGSCASQSSSPSDCGRFTDSCVASGGTSLPTDEPINVPIGIAEKVQNLYTWAVSLAGLVALGIIIFGGVLYAASAGNPSRITEAKTWITHALLGLSLLFGSYLILGFINPDLTRLEDIFLQQNVNPQSPGLELGAGVATDECIAEGREALRESLKATQKNTDCGGRYYEEAAGGGGRVGTLLARAGNFGDHPDCDRVSTPARDALISSQLSAARSTGTTSGFASIISGAIDAIIQFLKTQHMTNFVGDMQKIMRNELEKFKPDATCTLCCDSEIRAVIGTMTTVAGCETEGYNPNAVRLPGDPGPRVPQCTGAWGLFQMGKDGSPYQGTLDTGNVFWEDQVRYAIDHLMTVPGNYWECWGQTHQPSLDSLLGPCRCQVGEVNWCEVSDVCNPPICDSKGKCYKRKLC